LTTGDAASKLSLYAEVLEMAAVLDCPGTRLVATLYSVEQLQHAGQSQDYTVLAKPNRCAVSYHSCHGYIWRCHDAADSV
jgi:hypothetical protein